MFDAFFQLSSISDENFATNKETNVVSQLPEIETTVMSEVPVDEEIEIESEVVPESDEVKPQDDPKYSKYFKMVHVGVPVQAVKLKMQSDGFDPSILDGMWNASFDIYCDLR